jgi:hypothetical protein
LRSTIIPEKQGKQKEWDELLCKNKVKEILAGAATERDRASIKAGSEHYSGAWLNALPAQSLGLRLSDEEVRIAAALRIGAEICQAHLCVCGMAVDTLGYHGLSCSKSAGRRPRHSHLNALVSRALNSAQHPTRLEPPGLSRTDGKRPDGMTLIPWENGRSLLWDVTCVDTVAPSNVKRSATSPGSAACDAEKRKHIKYGPLKGTYTFIPLAFETMGPWGQEAKDFFQSLGAKLRIITGEENAPQFLAQSVSIALQKGNSQCIMGTWKEGDPVVPEWLPFD